jgi:two-component system response regulator HupR/HoxA
MAQSLVLVVDDEVRSQEAIRRTLEDEFEVLTVASGEEALELLGRESVHVILCDQRMPGMSGVEFLRQVREHWPDVVRIIISGYTDTQDIIKGVNDAGIYQYILKPWQPEALLETVRSAAQVNRLQRQNERLSLEVRTAEPVLRKKVEAKREFLRSRYHFAQITRAPDSPMSGICDMASQLAPYDISILLAGESGTGKELLARAIHYGSSRAEGEFVIENCGAMSDQILESELFGHKKGAFTGAFEDRIGLFEQADGGTIFLDEIGDTSPAFQVKLLRVLQEGEIRPLGSSRSRHVDVRVLSATNRDLEEEVRAGRFREDLYYRLTQFVIQVPPLRDRPMDVPLIAMDLLERARKTLNKTATGFTDEALESLAGYRWPGNVRELQNEIFRMLALSTFRTLGAELLSPKVLRAAARDQEGDMQRVEGATGNLKERLESLESHIIKETLIRHRWNKSRAAQELGLSRVGLRAKLQRYGLERK